MATTDELNVLLGADTSGLERGLAKGASSINTFAANATKAGTATEAAMQGLGQAALSASGLYVDATGRMRNASGQFASAAEKAAAAAGTFGGALGGTAGSMSTFASANAALAASFQKADASRDVLDKGFGRLGENLKGVGEGLTTYGSLPLIAFGGLAVKVGGDFESAFNRVEAATQAVGPELAALEQKAKAIALDPNLKFSATEAAGALEGLAKNGLNVTQILGGAADASVNLATATGGTLANAADITTDVMNLFGKTGTQLAGVVDNITGATIASKFGIEDYQQALAQAGGVAGQLGVSFEDFNTALSVTSSGFSSGSDAGTSFKTFLQRLVPQSKEAAEAMKRLGLNFFDAQGQMRPLREIAGELQEAFKGLSDSQRNELGTTIFGADSIRTALLLAKDGTKGFDQMAESIGKVNAAAQGKTLSQGFNGALEAFKSSLEGFQLAIAQSGILDFGTQLLKTAGEFIGGLAQLDPAILRTGTIIAALAAGIGPLTFAIGSVVAALPTLAAGFAVLTGPVGLGLAAVAGAAALIIDNWDELVRYFTTGSGGKVFGDLAESVTRSVGAIVSALGELAGSGSSLGELVSATGIVKGVFEEAAVEVTAFLDTITGGVNLVVKLFAGDFAGALDELGFAAEALTRPLRRLLGLTNEAAEPPKNAGYSDYFAKLTNDALGALQPVKQVAEATKDLQSTLATPPAGSGSGLTEDQLKALEKLREALRLNENLSLELGKAYDFVGERQSILETGVKDLVAVFGAGSPIVRKFREELQLLNEIQEGAKNKPLQVRTPTSVTPDAPGSGAGLDQGFKTLADYQSQLVDLQRQSAFLPVPQFAADGLTALFAQRDAYVAALASLTPAQVAAVQAQADFNTGMEQLFDSLGGNLANAATAIATSFGDAAGAIIANGASIGDGLAIVFGGILQALASFMGEFGQQLVTIGIGKLSLDTLFKGPAGGPLAIAAGLGLIALSGIAKSIAASSSRNLAGITGGSPSMGGGGVNTASPSPLKAQKLQIDVNFAPVQWRQEANLLRGVLQVDTYRVKRFN